MITCFSQKNSYAMGSWSVNKHLKLRNIREQKFCIEKWKKINKDNIVLKLHPNF